MDDNAEAGVAAVASEQDAVIGETVDGVIASWSEGAEELYGYRADEVVGRHVSILIPPDRAHEQDEIALRVNAGERLHHFETERVRKDGERVWVSLSISPVEDPDRHVVGALMVARDVTKARREDQMFRALLESAPDAMVIASPDGRIVLLNKQAEQIFGYQRQDLLGQPIEVLVPERLRDKHVGHRVRFFMDPNVRPMGAGLELFGRRKDGTEFPVDISLAPLETDDGVLVSAAIRDVTDRRAAEEQARRLDQMALRRRQALELNDEIVQGLTVAQLAHALGQRAETAEAIERTLHAAQAIISQMLAEEKADEPLREGALRRETAARVLARDAGVPTR